jgi:hypothetical protein
MVLDDGVGNTDGLIYREEVNLEETGREYVKRDSFNSGLDLVTCSSEYSSKSSFSIKGKEFIE